MDLLYMLCVCVCVYLDHFEVRRYVVGVCNTIRQPVTKEWLYEVIEKYGWKPTVVAPPPHHGEKRSHEVATDGANDDSLMPPPKKVPRPS